MIQLIVLELFFFRIAASWAAKREAQHPSGLLHSRQGVPSARNKLLPVGGRVGVYKASSGHVPEEGGEGRRYSAGKPMSLGGVQWVVP